MADPKTPTWDDIRGLIDRVDEVCRESEYLRASAERGLRRPHVWPDRRHEPRTHHDESGHAPEQENVVTGKGSGRQR